MPRIEVQGCDGTYYRTDEANINKAGEWLAWALAEVGASNYNPAQVKVYPLYSQAPGGGGPQLPDWPPRASNHVMFPIISIRSLIDRLQAIEKEQDRHDANNG
jgi:hypothetical protein